MRRVISARTAEVSSPSRLFKLIETLTENKIEQRENDEEAQNDCDYRAELFHGLAERRPGDLFKFAEGFLYRSARSFEKSGPFVVLRSRLTLCGGGLSNVVFHYAPPYLVSL